MKILNSKDCPKNISNGLGKECLHYLSRLRRFQKMGCDIHDFVEIKLNGKWEMVGEIFETCDSKRLSVHPYDGRNYTLFGILAGVRNKDMIPISEPKGSPNDASQGFLDELEQWQYDGHSLSYLTLQEILDYPLWDVEIPTEGLVSVKQYQELLELGKSRNGFFKTVNGPSDYVISNEEMDKYIANPEGFLKNNALNLIHHKKIANMKFSNTAELLKSLQVQIDEINMTGNYPDLNFYTEVKWFETVKEWAGEWFWNHTIQAMKDLAPDGCHDKIRMVFFFDN